MGLGLYDPGRTLRLVPDAPARLVALAMITELPPEEPPERVDRLRLHHYRSRGGRFVGKSTMRQPQQEHDRQVAEEAEERRVQEKAELFKPYVWRDPKRVDPERLAELEKIEKESRPNG